MNLSHYIQLILQFAPLCGLWLAQHKLTQIQTIKRRQKAILLSGECKHTILPLDTLIFLLIE